MSGDWKLLAAMRQSPQGRRRRDLDRLYTSYGFTKKEGAKHTVYSHPRFPSLFATVTRTRKDLPLGYVKTAVRLIDELEAKERELS